MGASTCAATGPFSCAFRRLRGERSSGLLSVPVGDLDPDLRTVLSQQQLVKNILGYMSTESERLRKVALNTYMPAGLADSADGETVCSRSGV